MTKDELIDTLHNVLNNYIFGMVSWRLVPTEAWQQIEKKRTAFQAAQGGTLTVHLGPLSKIMSEEANRKILIEEFEKGLKRAVMSEGHELLLWYCEQTNQVDVYKNESWFQFARIIRNIVSHKQGGTLREWPRDLKKMA